MELLPSVTYSVNQARATAEAWNPVVDNASEVNFYPPSKWLQRVHPFVFAKRGHDDMQEGNEDLVNTGLRFNVTRQGFFEVAHAQGHEAWHGQRYEVGKHIFVFGRMQVFRWLNVYAGNGRGPAIYYDDEDLFLDGR